MKNKAINYQFILLENYKKLAISEDELVVILLVDHFLTLGNQLVTQEMLTLHSNFDEEKVDKILTGLFKKKIIDFNSTTNGLSTSLEPLYKTLHGVFSSNFHSDNSSKHASMVDLNIKNVYSHFEEKFNRTLSAFEFDYISQWVDSGFSVQEILDALNEAVRLSKANIKYIDKLLIKYKTRKDMNTQEGYSAINNTWDKDIEETIRIANTNWLDDE